MKKIVFFFWFLLVLSACSDNSDQVMFKTVNADLYFVSQDSAILLAERAEKSLEKMKGSTASRCLNDRKVKNVEIVGPDIKSRSAIDNGVNSSLYIINYEDERGFAVVSSDKRLQPIYAVSDSGSLNIRDTLANKGLSVFFQSVQMDIARTSSYSPVIVEGIDGQSCIINAQVSPLIGTNARKWGQEPPYNKYCPKISNKTAFVGCAPVACGLIMSYYMWPRKITQLDYGYYDVALPWRSMKNGGNNDKVAFLFHFLGTPKMLNTKYSTNEDVGSVSRLDSIQSTFQKMGYSEPEPFKLFKSSDVCDILDDAPMGVSNNDGTGPILVAAAVAGKKGAHIWVIDGYAKNPVYRVDGSVLRKTLFHCVWGYNDGLNNGYFYFDENGQLGGKTNYFDMEDTGNNDVGQGTLYKPLLYMTGFKKNLDVASGGVEI